MSTENIHDVLKTFGLFSNNMSKPKSKTNMSKIAYPDLELNDEQKRLSREMQDVIKKRKEVERTIEHCQDLLSMYNKSIKDYERYIQEAENYTQKVKKIYNNIDIEKRLNNIYYYRSYIDVSIHVIRDLENKEVMLELKKLIFQKLEENCYEMYNNFARPPIIYKIGIYILHQRTICIEVVKD